MSKFKEDIALFVYLILILCFVWVSISSIILRFKCPKLTETEILISIPKSFVCDFKICE